MRHGNWTFVAAGLAALTLVAGCNGSTDPATAGLFDNIQNFNSGEYQRQISAKDDEARAIIRNNRAAQSRISSLKTQQSVNSSEISSLKAQLAQVKAQSRQARAQLAGQPAKLARLNSYDHQLTLIRADVNSGANPSASRAELNRLSAAIRALAN